jgi:hypothetical protein
MPYFLRGNIPCIVVQDERGRVHLDDVFAENYKSYVIGEALVVDGHHLDVSHVRLYSGDASESLIRYCAHDREVLSERLRRHIPGFPEKIRDEHGTTFAWYSFVSGKYLDEHVDQARSKFTFPSDDEEEYLDLVGFEPPLARSKIRKEVVRRVKFHTRSLLSALNDQKLERARAYAHYKAPRFVALVKHLDRDHLDAIPADPTDEELDQCLNRLYYEEESRIRAASQHLKGVAKTREEVVSKWNDYSKFIEDVNRLGQSNLAQYVAYRKLILDLLDENMRSTKQGTFELEETVHRVIMPLRCTSDDVPFEDQNLWIIDERLAYHSFMASDIPLSSLDNGVEVDDGGRPDLIVFNGACAFTDRGDESSSIVIVEFKRPDRNDYDGNKNPVRQVIKYINKIRSGIARDQHGRTIDGALRNVPIYCYIICDLTSKMVEVATEEDLHQTPDGMGYFKYHSSVRAYIEVMSYKKMLIDARRRNQVFFDRLMALK